jgi:putative hydrolase of the HAD superfamily
LATKKLGVRPEDCLYIGDGGSRELSGSSQAGMDAVQIDFRGDLEAYRPGAEQWQGRVITSLEGVLELVK